MVGAVPAEAVGNVSVNGRTYLLVSNGAKILGVIGIVLTARDLAIAGYDSYESGSPRPLAEETARAAGGFAGAIAGAKAGAAFGVAVGWETGPGAILTGLGGAFIGGAAGSKAVDITIDVIESDSTVNDPLWPQNWSEPPWQM